MLDAGAKSPLERTAQSSFKQDRIEGLPFPPMGLPGPGTSNRMISSRARKASIDVTEAAPTDKAARFRARKASMTAGDELYEGANGTKAGPGRIPRSRPMRAEASASGGMTPVATSETAHIYLRSYLSETAMAANIRSALNYDAGSSGSSSSSGSSGSSGGSNTSRSNDGSGHTELTARDQRVPTPPARKPDDIWAAVRARRVTAAAFNSDRRQRLQAMRQGQARLSCRHACRERSPVGEIVRV